MRNLTQAEARARAAVLVVASYDIELDLTHGDTWFWSTTVVRFTATPGASTFLELDCLTTVTATLDGRPISLQGNRFALEGLGGDHEVKVVARCAYTRSGEGLHRFVDPADDQVYVYAQAFLDDAQRIFACFDQPDLKAVFRLQVTAPKGHLVRSNTRGTANDGLHVFEQTAPLSTYHLTLAAGPWHGEQVWHDGIELGVWCRASLADHLDAQELLEITRQSLDLQQREFGSRYPFGDTYDQVFVPEFNAGAMENPGMVTFADEAFIYRSRTTEGNRRLRAQVIAHEMAHMWFGDLVTMRWWDGIWLNESFAEFMGLHTTEQATRFEGAWSDFCLGRKAWGYRADQLPTTHPVAGDVEDNRTALLNFDGISYAKGASVLRQLVAFVGQESFFTGLRAYLSKHAHGNTDLGDLLVELEAASGRELGQWADSWLRTSGVGTLRPRWDGDDLVVVQGSAVLRDHVVEIGFYDDVDGVVRLRERVPVEVRGADTPVPGARPADLVLVNDRDLTFAKIRFDDRSLATVLPGLARVEDPLARALCWGALWDAVRDGELSARDHVEAVLGGVVAEDDPSVVETLLGQALKAASSFALPAEQDALLERLSEACWSAPVEPGSDLQLVRVRAAVQATTDTTRLRDLLTGTAVPERLVVDSELRWHVVRRAAVLGELDEAAVERELAADRTASGQLQAEAALASLPDPVTKQRSWDTLIGGKATNAQVRAIGGGFWQRQQPLLLRPYVDRYLDVLPGLWRDRSPQLAGSLTLHLFPSTLIEPDVAKRVGAVLHREDLPAGLRRVVLEQHDDLCRGLAAQARSGG
ncbi:MAG: aminopeptidase [Frankiales bacterium]|nr:aminopeptidase [Frankiales bacterium]